MKLKIQFKILISFMAMVALIIALGIFALISIRLMTEATRELVYVQEREGMVADLQVTIDRAVTALGNYLVSGEKSHRTTFIQLLLLSKKQLETLEEPPPEGRREVSPIEVRERAKVAALKRELDGIDASSREILGLADTIGKGEGRKTVQDVVAMAKGMFDRRKGRGGEVGPEQELRELEKILGVSADDARKRIQEIETLTRTLTESEAR
ncbi:MAG: hypothetical protein NT045_00015, partial [Candidatus Aureabacteria bacterium]|nr:hypothetical protein [Candidatus Auribacterota bacterium]